MSNQVVEINLGSLLAEAVKAKAVERNEKKMQMWKKFLILSAGFFFLGGLGVSNSNSVLQMVGTVFIAIGGACLCVPILVFLKKSLPFIKRNFLKMVVAGYLTTFSSLVIACEGKLITILIMWAIAIPYLAKPTKIN